MEDWSGLISGVLSDASKGYIFQKYGFVSNSGQAYFKGADGNTYPQGEGASPVNAKQATSNNTMLIVGAVALIAVVMVMD